MILPGGRHDYLDQEALIELKNWVRSGGKLIVMESSLDKFVDQKGYGLKKFATDDEKKSLAEDKIKQEIEKINKKLSKIENIKKFFIIDEKFSIENGMLTPTLKLKRKKILEKYKDDLEKLY